MLLSSAGVQTIADRVQVRWESESATPMGQLAYFIEFLNLTGLWGRWLESCPLSYASPNAPSKTEVLGTWMLSVLSGHRRYASRVNICRRRCNWIATTSSVRASTACSAMFLAFIPPRGTRKSFHGRESAEVAVDALGNTTLEQITRWLRKGR